MPFRSLVLHDDAAVSAALVRALHRRGHHVVATAEPHGVLGAHRETPFALAVTRWGVAGRPGAELVRALRDVPHAPARPVVVVVRSGDGGGDVEEEAMLDAGAADVWSWPVTDALLGRRLLVAERQVLEAERRRQAEDALRRSAAGFRALLDQLPDGIGVHREARLVYLNAALVRMLGGGDGAGLVGRSLLEVARDPAALAAGLDAVARGEEVPPAEVELRGARGDALVAEVAHLRVDFEGAPATLTLLRDLGDRRRLEASLRQADRMASVGTLALGVAHELNNPLAYVVSNLQLLREELQRQRALLPLETAASLNALVLEAREGAARMRDVVRDLKTFSRDGEVTTQAVSIDGVLRACVHMTRNEIVHRAVFEEDLRPTPAVEGNESRLGQVFLNLLVNAAQALPDRPPADNRVALRAYTDGDGWAVVEVSDNGVGIDAADASRVFDPFFTTKPPGLGTGLGLSIVHNIVRSMDGEIAVQSRPGEGATFRVRLPPSARRSRARRSSSSTLEAVREVERPGRVLVVDDDALVAKSIVRVLAGHDVQVADGGALGLELLLGEAGFDLVLCDLMMPGVSGIELFDRVCAARPELAERFVFMTGGAFTPRARAFLDRVPNARIDKPFDPRDLRALVRARLGASGATDAGDHSPGRGSP